MHGARIRVEGLASLLDALSPEMSDKIDRSELNVRIDGDATIIEIEAEDATALRASLSSALRYIAAASSAVNAIDEDKEE